MIWNDTAKLQRRSAVGTVGVAAGVMLLWVVVFFWLAATRVPQSGVDLHHSLLIRITTFFPAFTIALVHILLGRQLARAARNSQ